MILDKEATVSDAQTLIGSFTAFQTTPVVSTNVYDTGARTTSADVNGPAVWPNKNNGNTVTIDNDLGKSEWELLIQITTAVLSLGSATIQFQFIHSDNSNLSSPEVIGTSELLAKATLVAGYQVRLGVPVGITKRYVGVRYFIGTADTTAGAFTASFCLNTNTQAI